MKVRARRNYEILFGFRFCNDNKRIIGDREVKVYAKINLKVTYICIVQKCPSKSQINVKTIMRNCEVMSNYKNL